MKKGMGFVVVVEHKTHNRCRLFLIRASTILLLVRVSALVIATPPSGESVGVTETHVQFLPPLIHYDITAAEVWRW